MKDKRKDLRTTIRTFVALLLVMLSLLSLVCYLNFDQNYREVKQSTYALMCEQVITDMETSIQYGKRMDRYYGIDAVLARTQALFDEGVMEAGILDVDGSLLYSTFDGDVTLQTLVQSTEAISSAASATEANGYTLFNRDNQEVLFMPVMDGNEKVGSFFLAYPTSVYAEQRVLMLQEVLSFLGIAFAVGVLVLWVYYYVISRRLTQIDTKKERFFFFRLPSAVLIVLILLTGMVNFLFFQDRYEATILEDTTSIVEYVGATTQELYNKGVSYDDMAGLEEYLAEKVKSMPVLAELRVSSILSDSGSVLGNDTAGVVSTELKAGNEELRVEAFISDEYVQSKMKELFLLFLAMFIFSIVIIFEMTRLPAMFSQRRSRGHGNAEDTDTFEYISSSIRIMTFLRTLGNYMYVPYSALLIKQWNQAVGSLSVGVTAALPLSVEGAAQMMGLMLYPIWIKRPDQKCRRFFMICFIGMLAINIGCFLTHSALVIIVLRFLGGFSYAGFMYTVNMVVANGDNSEARHQINLSQSNAGIIGGNMCGAGIGAVIAALAGYSFSYVASALVFAACGIFVLKMLPWAFLEKNACAKEKGHEKSSAKIPLSEYVRIIFSPSVLRYFILVMVPVFFGVLFTATLIPTLTTARGSELLLSYCYIANGLAGFYLGPLVVRFLSGRISVPLGVSGALLLGALAIAVLEIPPFFIMVLVSSALLGVFDGYGSPMATDGFLSIPVVKHRVNEVTALALYMTLSSLVMTFAPIFIEMLTQISLNVAVIALAGCFLICAVLFALTSNVDAVHKRRKEQR